MEWFWNGFYATLGYAAAGILVVLSLFIGFFISLVVYDFATRRRP